MEVRVKESLFTNGASYGKGFYKVPEQMPENVARELVKCGHAEFVGEQLPANKAERKVKTNIEKR